MTLPILAWLFTWHLSWAPAEEVAEGNCTAQLAAQSLEKVKQKKAEEAAITVFGVKDQSQPPLSQPSTTDR